MTDYVTSNPAANLLYPGINGAIASFVVGSPTTFTVSPGIVRDQYDTYDMNLGNFGGYIPTLTANVTTTVNSGVIGVNGIDTGVLQASKLYYVYVIGDSTGFLQPACIMSLTGPSTGPLLPSGYNLYRHVDFMKTNASTQFVFKYTYGESNCRYLSYVTPFQVGTGLNATLQTSLALNQIVPAEANLQVDFSVSYVPATAGNSLTLRVAAQSVNQASVVGQVASVAVAQQFQVTSTLVSSLPVVDYFVSNASDAATVSVYGFTFSV